MTSLAQTSTQICLGLLLPGAGLTVVLLALYAYAAWYPVSRKHLDRVSFRLLVYALLANLTFGIVFLIVTLVPFPGWECGFLMFLSNLSLEFSAGMFFCIGINLPLVLTFNLNGQRMEKYYIMGTALISGVCTIVPYASGQFGWDTAANQCWYRSADPASRLRWFVGTQTFWLLFASFGEVVAFLITVGHLVTYERLATDLRSRPDAKLHETYSSSISRNLRMRDPVVRNMILRVGLYPFVSCLLSISTSTLDLHGLIYTAPTEFNLRLGLADIALFSARALIYGLLAATDPSFLRAIRVLHPGSKILSDLESNSQGAGPCFSTVLEFPLATVESERGKDDMLESLELGQTTKGDGGTSENGGEEERAGLPVHALDPAQPRCICDKQYYFSYLSYRHSISAFASISYQY
ncbi:hypothetical protein B0H16DRAFT_1695408 [Mycena metata]|uniref:Uncharacterized protein n=1 Tax=Mycena metata TaxID=1033252 RepID=A0AAD7I6P8_9AGAR|nr:hypothetical protein B0H16DRAFT_1695408 [Mycena metata]